MKIHMRKSANSILPACGAMSSRYGVALNSLKVSPKSFKTLPAEDRCCSCQKKFIELRNKQRRAKGLEPVYSAEA